jgi:hypothetical protein
MATCGFRQDSLVCRIAIGNHNNLDVCQLPAGYDGKGSLAISYVPLESTEAKQVTA